MDDHINLEYVGGCCPQDWAGLSQVRKIILLQCPSMRIILLFLCPFMRTILISTVLTITPRPISILMPDPYLRPESTEGLIEEQAFLLSYVSAPCLHPSSFFRQQVVSLSQPFRVSPVDLSDGRGVGGGEEPKRMTLRNPGPLLIIQYTLLASVLQAGTK
jgi:hypothetical protein